MMTDLDQKIANVYQRIHLVMNEVRYVQKDANVGNYRAVTHDQVVSVARESIIKHGLTLVVSQTEGNFEPLEQGKKMRLYTGKYDISLVNIDDPKDRVTVNIEAHAQDSGDKAPGKCCTYATKTAILKLLWLETGESDESRAEVKNIINLDQQGELATLINGDETLWNHLCNSYKISGLSDIKEKQFSEIKKRIADYRRNRG